MLTNPLRWWLDRENADRLGADEVDDWLDALTPAPSPASRRQPSS